MPTHIKGHNRSTISVQDSCQYLMLRSTEFLQMNLTNFWPEKGASSFKIDCTKGRVSNTIHTKNMLLLARAPPSTTWRASLLLRQRAKRGKEVSPPVSMKSSCQDHDNILFWIGLTEVIYINMEDASETSWLEMLDNQPPVSMIRNVYLVCIC